MATVVIEGASPTTPNPVKQSPTSGLLGGLFFLLQKSPTLPQQKVYDATLVKGSQGAPLYEPMHPCVCEN